MSTNAQEYKCVSKRQQYLRWYWRSRSCKCEKTCTRYNKRLYKIEESQMMQLKVLHLDLGKVLGILGKKEKIRGGNINEISYLFRDRSNRPKRHLRKNSSSQLCQTQFNHVSDNTQYTRNHNQPRHENEQRNKYLQLNSTGQEFICSDNYINFTMQTKYRTTSNQLVQCSTIESSRSSASNPVSDQNRSRGCKKS